MAHVLLRVAVVEARDIPCIGPNQPSNPYCVISLSDSADKYATRIIDATREPRWNEDFRFLVGSPDTSFLRVTLCHKDGVLDDEVGRTNIPLSGLPLGQMVDRPFTFDPVPGFPPGAQIRLILELEQAIPQFYPVQPDFPGMVLPDGYYPPPEHVFMPPRVQQPAQSGDFLQQPMSPSKKGPYRKAQGNTGRQPKKGR
jgi:hypothetical protein